MNISRRGAVIATGMLAGALGLSSLFAMSGPAIAVRRGCPAEGASAVTLGSLPRPSQVRPADVVVKSTPASSPSAIPTAQPSTAAAPRPTTVVAEPPSWPAPAPTPWPTPRPVAAPTPTPVPTPAGPIESGPLPALTWTVVNQGGAPVVSTGTSVSASYNYAPGTYTTGIAVSTSWGDYSLCAEETVTEVSGVVTTTFSGGGECGVDLSWQGLQVTGSGSSTTSESITVTLSWYQP